MESFAARVAMHAALGDPVRLAVVDELASSDRSPKELSDLLGVPANLLAHHLQVLEDAGLITRGASTGDRRRRYVQLQRAARPLLAGHECRRPGRVLFVCTHNSARSQLAAALWQERTGEVAESAGTDPAPAVHPGALAAARRAGLDVARRVPRRLTTVPPDTQVITVCDRAHEELDASPEWWHWSIPDPVDDPSPDAFDHVVDELDERIATIFHP